ncbi:MAG: alkaline shock response membrane anchor protein AmaP [Clostridiales bacterium]|nr:alkaline shock response membrane anchor protein AmaP [Clostridiales bacterium]
MRASFWDRVLMFLFVLLAFVLLLGTALRPLGTDMIREIVLGLEAEIGEFGAMLVAYGLTAIVALLGVYMLMMIFRRGARRDRAFITVNSGDGGRVRIALSALEQMARQAIGHVEGVQDMKIRIGADDDSISVSVDLSLLSDSHVPTVTMNMQRTIRNNIEVNCGVAVRTVEITVSSLAGAAAAAKPQRVTKRGRVWREIQAAPHAPEPVRQQENASKPERVSEPEPEPEPQPEQVFEPEQVPDPEPYPEPEAAVPDDPVVDDLFEVEGEFADAEEEKPAEPEN